MKTCTCGTLRFVDHATGALQHCPYHDAPPRSTSMVESLLAAVALVYLALTLTGCATLGGVVDEQARSVTWTCDGPAKARLQAHRLIVECPTGPAPTLVVETVAPVVGP